MEVDVKGNRSGLSYPKRVYLYRLLWSIFRVVLRCTPEHFWFFKNLLLRLFGASIGKHVRISSSADLFMPWNLKIGDYVAIGSGARLYCLDSITLKSRTTVSQGAYLCTGTHDISSATRELVRKPIVIESDSWICAQAFIGPGVNIGRASIVGARSVVIKDVNSDLVVAGNPAKIIKRLS